MFGLTPEMQPVERNNENQVDASIDIEIVVCVLLFLETNLPSMFHIEFCYLSMDKTGKPKYFVGPLSPWEMLVWLLKTAFF